MTEKRIAVRRRRREKFAQVPHGISRDPTLSDKALRLWVVLQCYADWDDHDCFPSMGTLATDMGCHRATVIRAVEELTVRQLLEVESGQKRGEPNVYTVIDPVGGNAPTQQGCSTHATPGSAPTQHRGSAPTQHKQEPREREPPNKTAPDGAPEEWRPSKEQRDACWDALVRELRWKPITGQDRSRMGKAVSELTAAVHDEFGAEAVDKIDTAVIIRVGRYVQRWGRDKLTPEALSKHWTELGKSPGATGTRAPSPAEYGAMSQEEFDRHYRTMDAQEQIAAEAWRANYLAQRDQDPAMR